MKMIKEKSISKNRCELRIIPWELPCSVEKKENPQSGGEFCEKLFADAESMWKTQFYKIQSCIYEEVSLKTLRVSGAFS